MPSSLSDVKGIGPATAEQLASAGITTLQELAAATPDQLAAVPGFGHLRAGKVLDYARQLLSATHPGKDTTDATGAAVLAKSEKGSPPKHKAASKIKANKKEKSEKKKAKKNKQAKTKGKDSKGGKSKKKAKKKAGKKKN